MRRRRRREDNQERWMVSYADFMTLLFAFFVVLYSSSQVDKLRMAKLSSAITAGFSHLGNGEGQGGATIVVPDTIPMPPPYPANDSNSAHAIRAKLERGLSEELERRTVSVREIPDGLVLSLREVGFFESGSATLRASSMDTFDRLGSVLGSEPSNLRIEGHTDNIPIHTPQFQSNWELSTARASEIIRILLTREHIEPQRLSAAGYAEYHPVADNATEDGRRLNRRVDIVIVAPHESPAPIKPPPTPILTTPVKDSSPPAD